MPINTCSEPDPGKKSIANAVSKIVFGTMVVCYLVVSAASLFREEHWLID
jgi:hypothetical protein